jgi:hypothetical protein
MCVTSPHTVYCCARNGPIAGRVVCSGGSCCTPSSFAELIAVSRGISAPPMAAWALGLLPAQQAPLFVAALSLWPFRCGPFAAALLLQPFCCGPFAPALSLQRFCSGTFAAVKTPQQKRCSESSAVKALQRKHHQVCNITYKRVL